MLSRRVRCEHIGRERLSNDALIAMSAGRLGITVITANEKDFARLSEFSSLRLEASCVLAGAKLQKARDELCAGPSRGEQSRVELALGGAGSVHFRALN